MQLRYFALLWLAFLSFSASAQRYLEMIEAGTYTVAQIQQEAEAYFDIKGRGKGTGYKQFKRWEYVALMEMDESGRKISNFELSSKARDYRRAEKQKRAESNFAADDWKPLGPDYRNATSSWNPGVGRVTSIGIDKSNTNHLIVGSPTGGVWKSLDGGNTWMPLTDDFATTDVFSLEISPYNSNHYLWGGASGKIYSSTDAGATWTATGHVTGSGRVSRIEFHPTDPNIVFAASESNGLFRSTNGGNTWTVVSGLLGVSGYDIEFKPGSPNTIYFSGTAAYRSTNGGTSFTQISGLGTETNKYKMMAVSAANPNIVYLLESDGGKFGAFYKSTNSGASFTKLIDGADINFFGYSATGDDDRGQAPRDMDVVANPANANEVHIAGIHTWKSINGGVSFNLTSHWVPSTAASLGVGYNHADIAILKFAGNKLYVGSDGGLHTSNDGAASYTDRSTGLGIREFYKIGVSKTNPNVVSGGSQDNGTSVMRGPNREWVDWLGADGMETFVSWNNANILFGTSQYGSMYRSTNQGTSQSSISKPPGVDDGAWVTPFEQDPQVANTIYVAFADVWKSTNSGGDWTKISSFNNGNMNQMKLAPSDNKRIYVSRGSTLFTTADGGTSWTTATTAWGSSTVNYIAIHPLNPQRVLIVTTSTVYQSVNAGASWTNIGVGLPSGAKYCAAWENTGQNGIYVGGFGYISYTNDAFPGQWLGYMNGLPNARVYELEINYVSNTIFAGTYGRGLWESPIYQAQAPVAGFSADKRIGCREMTVAFTDLSSNGPTAWEWTFEGGTPATSNLQNPVVTFSGNGTHSVQLKSSNNGGDNISVQSDYITIVSPDLPSVADAERCGPGELMLEASGSPANQFLWYASETDPDVLFSGELYMVNIAQTNTYYVSAATNVVELQHVGPLSNTIGTGGDHSGGYYHIMDVEKPCRIVAATVYANGAADRVFRLLDASGNTLLEKTVFINDGESRINLDMEIPAGADLQLGCPSAANLYRNNSGVNYPYSFAGVLQIKSSTAGSGYYYYLYDLEVESETRCESDRVAVNAVVNPALPTPVVQASASTDLCPGETLVLTANNPCQDCTVYWSNGESGPSITVSTEGIYTAILRNTCGDGPVSNSIAVSTTTLPLTPNITASGATTLCPGESLTLATDNLCAACIVSWSDGSNTPEITVSTAGTYTASFSNICGESPASLPLTIETATPPLATIISASGAIDLCMGETVVLTADNPCPDCSVHWSNGETGTSITVSSIGSYTATLRNVCGDGPLSNTISVTSANLPNAPVIAASGATTFCSGESVILTAQNVCADCTVQWSNGESEADISVTASGIYTAIFKNECGESQASNSIEVVTATLPSAPVLSALGATVLCPGESVAITAENLCGACDIHWSNGESTPLITVSTAGVYTANFSNICGDGPLSSSIEVSQENLPSTPVISASGATALCPGESVVLSIDGLCPGCTVLWSNGESTPDITVFVSGDYTAAISNNCGSSPVSNTIEVSQHPSFLPLLQIDNVCHLSAPTGSNYQWTLDGVAISGATGQFWTAAVSGLYAVSMLDTSGCYAVSDPVFVQACVSSTHDLEGFLSVQVYPNPAQDKVFLDLNTVQASELRLDLFASDGRFVGQLFQGRIAAGKQVIDIALPSVAAGIYRYRLATETGSVNGNLVIQR